MRLANRIFAVALPFVCAGGLGVGTASATTSYPVTCTKLAGSQKTLTANLTGCSSMKTGGTGKIKMFKPSGGVVTWANGTSSTFKTTPQQQGPGTCPSTASKFVLRGSITSSTNKSLPKGSPVAMTVCAAKNGTTLTNASGTSVKF